MPSTRKVNHRAVPLKVHFRPDVESDRIVLDAWNACRVHERAPHIFRTALLKGLRMMVDSGELPDEVLNHHRLRERLARRLPNAFVAPPATVQAAVIPLPVQAPQAQQTTDTGYVPGGYSLPGAAEPEAEVPFDDSAILDLMPSFE